MKDSNPRTFLPHQFSNEANIDAHFTGTGPEIWLQLQGQGLTSRCVRRRRRHGRHGDGRRAAS